MNNVRIINIDGKDIQAVTIDGREYLVDGRMFDERGVIKPWVEMLKIIGKFKEKTIALGKTDQIIIKMIKRGEKPNRDNPIEKVPLKRWQSSYDKLVGIGKIK